MSQLLVDPPTSVQEDKPFLTRSRRQLIWGIAFLAPNLIGFLVFTLIPLVMSLVLAFSNWDLRLHNMFKDERVKFVGVDHFIRLFTDEDFWKFLGNTLFFMISLPIGIALSLISALLLTQDLRGGSKRHWAFLIVGSVMIASCVFLASVGMGAGALTIVLTGLFGLILIGGTLGGQTLYRTLFYIPNFTAGVATMLLWKNLYNPVYGPINNVLAGPVGLVGETVGTWPQGLMNAILIALVLTSAVLVHVCAVRLLRKFADGDLGTVGLVVSTFVLLLPAWVCFGWMPGNVQAWVMAGAVVIAVVTAAMRVPPRQLFKCSQDEGLGGALMVSVGTLVASMILMGFGLLFHHLPAMSADGLEPPLWLNDANWSKPSIMIMGLWAAIGSQTMLLYIAALLNVPGELYEAADIDGASPSQKFWTVTWPMLAPTTFFVVVMGVIGGLQAGFEVARVMTKGGPAGSSTTLAYFIYTEGFETGRLGFSSAVSWTMFLMVLVVTVFNWKFGNRYVND
jgi:multiple sugar transport system permease protein